MTLRKKEIKDYDEYDALKPHHLTQEVTQVEIVKEPRIVKTKFTDEQPVIDVKLGVEIFTWWANWTSMNELISRFGEDESKHVGKHINLVTVKQPVEGKMKKVIYLEGSFKEEDG